MDPCENSSRRYPGVDCVIHRHACSSCRAALSGGDVARPNFRFRRRIATTQLSLQQLGFLTQVSWEFGLGFSVLTIGCKVVFRLLNNTVKPDLMNVSGPWCECSGMIADCCRLIVVIRLLMN